MRACVCGGGGDTFRCQGPGKLVGLECKVNGNKYRTVLEVNKFQYAKDFGRL